jgi:hypothetical protein
MNFDRMGYLCFSYDVQEFPEGPKEYFKSFPILRFLASVNNKPDDETVNLDWYPSEYLYREREDRYCVGIDISESSYLTLGGTLLRQHNILFDIENNKVGFARASCSHDPNQIISE